MCILFKLEPVLGGHLVVHCPLPCPVFCKEEDMSWRKPHYSSVWTTRGTWLWDKPQRVLVPSCGFSPTVWSGSLPRQEGPGRENCHLNPISVKRHLVESPGKMRIYSWWFLKAWSKMPWRQYKYRNCFQGVLKVAWTRHTEINGIESVTGTWGVREGTPKGLKNIKNNQKGGDRRAGAG